MRVIQNDLSQLTSEDCVTDSTRLVLASSSPRRSELLSLLGVPFTIVTTDAEESDSPPPPEIVAALPPSSLPLAQHPTLLAWRKAHAVWSHDPAHVVLGADTIVVLDGAVLGKPRDAAHARAMLAQLAGQVHTVYTGVCVCGSGSRADAEYEPSAPVNQFQVALVTSDVTIAPLDREEIAAYVATGEPLDKAGAYGIQGLGGQLVRRVVGSYTAVVGLPLPTTWRMLTAVGISGLAEPTAAYRKWLQYQGKEPLPCPPTLP